MAQDSSQSLPADVKLKLYRLFPNDRNIRNLVNENSPKLQDALARKIRPTSDAYVLLCLEDGPEGVKKLTAELQRKREISQVFDEVYQHFHVKPS